MTPEDWIRYADELRTGLNDLLRYGVSDLAEVNARQEMESALIPLLEKVEEGPGITWRVGKKVPLNVYEGDRPVCQCHNAEDAQRIVQALAKADGKEKL